MSDIDIRIEGHTGRITLNRPGALNALTYEMCLAIEAALDAWREDDAVALVIIDAEGERAFSAGGDIAKMYETASAGEYDYGRQFWRDEYRLNAKIANYPKPYVAFMQGFTMGGGVGVSCHGSHRIVGDTSRIAMPECGIGLVPDVGGSLLLAQAPGNAGEYLGTTGARMGPGDAIWAGFADGYLPEAMWGDVKSKLVSRGDINVLTSALELAPEAKLSAFAEEIDAAFSAPDLSDVMDRLTASGTEFAQKAAAEIAKKSPLSVAVAHRLISEVRALGAIEAALEMEFRVTSRSAEFGDFLEGIRAAIIDKDNAPKWRHSVLADVSEADIAAMLAPLGDDGLRFD